MVDGVVPNMQIQLEADGIVKKNAPSRLRIQVGLSTPSQYTRITHARSCAGSGLSIAQCAIVHGTRGGFPFYYVAPTVVRMHHGLARSMM